MTSEVADVLSHRLGQLLPAVPDLLFIRAKPFIDHGTLLIDPLWQLLGPILARPLIRLNVPILRSFLWCSYMGWTTTDQGRCHLPKPSHPPTGSYTAPTPYRNLGPAFILVSPSRTEFFTTDPKMAMEVAKDWRTYTKPGDLYKVFDVFGPNVNTVNGADWQRHRKITGAAFLRDECLKEVWLEARDRALELVQHLVGRPPVKGVAAETKSDTELNMTQVKAHVALLTMSVLSVAAFGSAGYKAADSGERSLHHLEPGHALTYFNTVRLIFTNLIGVIMFGTTGLPRWLLPKQIRQVKIAVEEYLLFLKEALTRYHKARDSDQSTFTGNDLVSQMVKANEAEKRLVDEVDKQQNAKAPAVLNSYLTDSELFGNMFMVNIAGYETTSMALNFAIAHLAKEPGLWEWLREEVDVLVEKEGSLVLSDYGKCFEKLVRTRALMVSRTNLYILSSGAWCFLSVPDQ